MFELIISVFLLSNPSTEPLTAFARQQHFATEAECKAFIPTAQKDFATHFAAIMKKHPMRASYACQAAKDDGSI